MSIEHDYEHTCFTFCSIGAYIVVKMSTVNQNPKDVHENELTDNVDMVQEYQRQNTVTYIDLIRLYSLAYDN